MADVTVKFSEFRASRPAGHEMTVKPWIVTIRRDDFIAHRYCVDERQAMAVADHEKGS